MTLTTLLLLFVHSAILPTLFNRERRLDLNGQAQRLARLAHFQPPRRIVPLGLVRAMLYVAVLPLAGIADVLVKALVPRSSCDVEGG